MDNNKKSNKTFIGLLIGGIVIVILLILGLFGAMYFATSSQDRVYEEANTIPATDALTLDGKNIYYYYQEDCSHCNEIKPDVTTFSDEIKKYDVGFNIIDMADSKNSDAWLQNNDQYESPLENPDFNSKPEDIKSADDIKIAGTPTMIYADGDKVKSVSMGNGVYEVMNYALKDVNSDLTIEEPTA